VSDVPPSDPFEQARRNGVPVLRPGFDEDGPLFNEGELFETIAFFESPEDARKLAADMAEGIENPNVIFAELHFLLVAHIRPERAERIRRHLRMSQEMFRTRVEDAVRAFGPPAAGDQDPAA
jgi:hypothetical protein